MMDPAKSPALEVPISKHLVSHELDPKDRAKYIGRLLKSREEQEGARQLEEGEASRFIELLDQVCYFSSQSPVV